MPSDKNWHVNTNLMVTIIGTLLSAGIGFNAWAVVSLYGRPTEQKVREMIEDKSPYREDRNMILQSLERVRDDIAELKILIRNQ